MNSLTVSAPYSLITSFNTGWEAKNDRGRQRRKKGGREEGRKGGREGGSEFVRC